MLVNLVYSPLTLAEIFIVKNKIKSIEAEYEEKISKEWDLAKITRLKQECFIKVQPIRLELAILEICREPLAVRINPKCNIFVQNK